MHASIRSFTLCCAPCWVLCSAQLVEDDVVISFDFISTAAKELPQTVSWRATPKMTGKRLESFFTMSSIHVICVAPSTSWHVKWHTSIQSLNLLASETMGYDVRCTTLMLGS